MDAHHRNKISNIKALFFCNFPLLNYLFNINKNLLSYSKFSQTLLEGKLARIALTGNTENTIFEKITYL